MRSPWRRLVAALTLSISAAGCQTAAPPHPVVVAPAGVELPFAATILFEVPPPQRDFNVSAFGPYVWSYPESRFMREAALHMLQAMFTDVIPIEGPEENGLVFQVSGYTSINPAVSTYYATAVADVFTRTEAGERQIGHYRGTGQAWGRIYSYPPLQAAYAAAFTALSREMLADPTLMRRINAEAIHFRPRASTTYPRLQ